MNNSRINCRNIRKPNCEFYDEYRLCPPDCIGYTPKVPEPVVEEDILDEAVEDVSEESEARPKRTYNRRA